MTTADVADAVADRQRLWSGLLVGVALSFVAALGGGLAPRALLAGAAGAALVLGPLTAALAVLGPNRGAASAIPAGALVAAGPLALAASVLKTATHHRPLGAVTFALLAALVLLGAIALAARLHERRARGGLWHAAWLASLALGAVLAAWRLLPLARASLALGSCVLVLALVGSASQIRLPATVARPAVALSAWLALVLAGQALGADASPLAWPLGALG